MTYPEFISFPSIARLSKNMIITEKLDGTNAQIHITDDGRMIVGSRSRWITPEDDNFGFARWAHENQTELLKLGPGSHFGEWWGKGIQRGYGLTERRFSLFNTTRWSDPASRPSCCHVVPVLLEAQFDTGYIEGVLLNLSREGCSGVLYCKQCFIQKNIRW